MHTKLRPRSDGSPRANKSPIDFGIGEAGGSGHPEFVSGNPSQIDLYSVEGMPLREKQSMASHGVVWSNGLKGSEKDAHACRNLCSAAAADT